MLPLGVKDRHQYGQHVERHATLVGHLEVDQEGRVALGVVQGLGRHREDLVVVSDLGEPLLRRHLFAAADEHGGRQYDDRGEKDVLQSHGRSPWAKSTTRTEEAEGQGRTGEEETARKRVACGGGTWHPARPTGRVPGILSGRAL